MGWTSVSRRKQSDLHDSWDENSDSICPGPRLPNRDRYKIHPWPVPIQWDLYSPFRFQLVAHSSDGTPIYTGGCRHLIYARILDETIRQSVHWIHDHRNGTYTVEFIVVDAGLRMIEIRMADGIGFGLATTVVRFPVLFTASNRSHPCSQHSYGLMRDEAFRARIRISLAESVLNSTTSTDGMKLELQLDNAKRVFLAEGTSSLSSIPLGRNRSRSAVWGSSSSTDLGTLRSLARHVQKEAKQEDALAIYPILNTNLSTLPICVGSRHEGRWIRCPIEETALYSPALVHNSFIRTKYSSAPDQEQGSIDEPFSVAAFRWQPFCCRYHHYTRAELQSCFTARRIWIHYLGDSVSRDTFHDFPEFLWQAPRAKLHSNVFAAPESNDFIFTFNWLGNSLRKMLETNLVNVPTLAPWSTPTGMGSQYPEWNHGRWDFVTATAAATTVTDTATATSSTITNSTIRTSTVRRVPDVWIFNIGLWDNNPHDVFQWKKDLISFAQIIREIHIAYPKMRLFWRTITPLGFPAAQFREYNAAALRVFDDVGLDVEVWDAAVVVDSQNHDHGEAIHFAGVAGRTYSNILANLLCNDYRFGHGSASASSSSSSSSSGPR